MRRLLVTGATGQLGRELQALPLPRGWVIEATDRSRLDLGDPAAIAAFVVAGDFAAVINAAAYTAVDQAEGDMLAAWQINAMAPAALASGCAEAGIPIVHVSTDYVFDGQGAGAREPGDPVGPISVYGASKLGGELAVATSGARHVILRTAWVVSAHGRNFVKTMLRLAADHDVVRVVADQHGSPTSAADLAAATLRIALRLADDSAAPVGVYHFSNAGPTHWADFARAIFAQSVARGGPGAAVENVGSDEYPTVVKRPANSLLGCATLERDYGIVPRPWPEALADIMDQLVGVTG
ncbi:dTDP-4-dehydrorhamnose reductase [Sphingobium sp. CAP-1]|uniref:dTDP-4-dehydrorhamnose reductase n=1 Tax=Sphingobium sp. CAP-1 TaxID=2676077 RepID=UPI0012BB23BC|nr:dTDP-4-dehydrorhamnose reductase [Sphingobium sp. CAP-1]QGP78215.1 dTDP-4-dehydrorhamnose reductase [Sphingobium sp. CAP-1]